MHFKAKNKTKQNNHTHCVTMREVQALSNDTWGQQPSIYKHARNPSLFVHFQKCKPLTTASNFFLFFFKRSKQATRTDLRRLGSLFLHSGLCEDTPPPSTSPSVVPPPRCWFQEAEAGMLVCFQKSLTTLTAGRQTAEKHDGELPNRSRCRGRRRVSLPVTLLTRPLLAFVIVFSSRGCFFWSPVRGVKLSRN